MPRGRPRTSKSTLPPCYHLNHGAVYHVVKNVWRRAGTAADAHAEYAERLRQGNQGQLDALIDAVFARMKARKVKPLSVNTTRAYTQAAGRLKSMLRKFSQPQQVKQKDAAQIKVLLAGTPGMANNVLSFGRQVFADFVEHQLLDSNPFIGVERCPVNRRTRLITQDEWDKIYKLADARLRLIMDGLYLTDQRIGDVLRIDERQMLDEGVYFKQQKTRKELIVEWNPQLREWVAACRALHGKVVSFAGSDRPRPLFRNRHGRSPSYKVIYEQWVATVKRAGIEDCNLHDNRAFSATDAQRQGLDPQKLLGHQDAATTKIYLRGREIDIVQGPQMRRILGA